MNDIIIYETETFIVCVPKVPHIPREDGGHIWIRAKEKYFASRLDLRPKEAIEVMRLTMLVSEAMISCYDEPEMVHLVLKKATEFLINYLQAYKDLGIDGVFMAEPLAGILSPNLCDEFSSRYVKEIVSALDDDSFLVAYHNCGNNTLKMVDTILSTGCRLYHFGNAISIEQMLKLMPKDVMVMGNIDPVSLKDASKEDVIAATNALLEAVGDVDNFVISSGCDIPPFARWENIDAFMKTAQEYYQK